MVEKLIKFPKNNIFLNNNLKGKGYKTGDQFLLSNASGTEITTISITALMLQ